MEDLSFYFEMNEVIFDRIGTYLAVYLPDRKKTTTTELTMENQWIWTSLMVKYVSHRDAHLTSLS